jgi:hypothetical protein
MRYKYHKDGTLPLSDAVLVFDSNLAGVHGAGAALVAKEKFGALDRVGVGLFWCPRKRKYSYAIPTKDKKLCTLPLDVIEGYIDLFLDSTADYDFQGDISSNYFVNRIGCGLAGYDNW